ncbi:DUF1775 domain-containing protein [Synechococcus sp. R70.1]|uniref:DUF1775 domain-containing protein n=1 Tax=Synechococcus sp. R70.1 TaxID=2964531 RepID=UPI0039C1425B
MSFLPLSSAWAHVTVHPQEAPAGSYTKLTFRVPHGCDGSPKPSACGCRSQRDLFP